MINNVKRLYTEGLGWSEIKPGSLITVSTINGEMAPLEVWNFIENSGSVYSVLRKSIQIIEFKGEGAK